MQMMRKPAKRQPGEAKGKSGEQLKLIIKDPSSFDYAQGDNIIPAE